MTGTGGAFLLPLLGTCGFFSSLAALNRAIWRIARSVGPFLARAPVSGVNQPMPTAQQQPKKKSYVTEGQYIALVVGRYGEFSKDFVKMRDYIAREKAYAYNERFNSSVNMALSIFKLSITSRWALMAARGWARLILIAAAT
jgi:hypothetical protein